MKYSNEEDALKELHDLLQAFSAALRDAQARLALKDQQCRDLQAENKKYSEDMEILQDMYYDLRARQQEVQEPRPMQDDENSSAQPGAASSAGLPAGILLPSSCELLGPSAREVHVPARVHERAEYRDKHPSLNVIQTGSKNDRNPKVPGLEDIGDEEMHRVYESIARQSAWKLHKETFQ